MHYRRAGRGPALVMLHQSPLSSADLVSTMSPLAEDFTCLAFDTAGYGHSDPLGRADPAIDDYADAMIAALDQLGVGRFALFGNHTGSCIAAAIAARRPDRVSAFVADGYVAFSDEERLDFTTHYTPSVAPRWDASHLVWIWARMRNEYAFFPWHRAGLSLRVDVDLPGPPMFHERLLDWLRAGEDYWIGYRAAFRFSGATTIGRVRCPTLLVTMQPDPLVTHLERLNEIGPNISIVRTGWDRGELVERSRDFLRRHAGDAPTVPTATEPHATGARQTFLTAGAEQYYARAADGEGRPVVIIHEAGQSSAQGQALFARLAGVHRVLAADRPGHGESTKGTVDSFLQAIRAWAGEPVDVIALGGAAGAATALIDRGLPVRKLAMVAPPTVAAATLERWERLGALPLTPDWYGGYLLQAWHMARDAGLFDPWFERNRGGISRQEPTIDPQDVHRRTVDLLKSLGAPNARREEWRRLTQQRPSSMIGVFGSSSGQVFGGRADVSVTGGETVPSLFEFLRS